MKATKEQIQAWVETHGTGNIIELTAQDKCCYIFDPATNLSKMKAAIAARRKSIGDMVDSVINNCWLGGDESFKTNERLKLDLEDQVDDLMDIPEPILEKCEEGYLIIVDDFRFKVKKATRQQIRYAEERNKDNKPLQTAIHLLDKIAIDDVSELQQQPKLYLSVLLAVNDVKDKEHVQIKKY